MELKAAKCTQCGADIKVDTSKEAGVCEYCGSAFVVEKAVNNYNVANAQINAGTVNVTVGGGDFVIEKGVLKSYKGSAKEIVIPDTVMVINGFAFNDCITVKSVVIPEGVTSISSNAFYNCVNLEEVTLPASVKELSVTVFTGCPKINKMTLNGDITIKDTINGRVKISGEFDIRKKYRARLLARFLRGNPFSLDNYNKTYNHSVFVNGNEVIERLNYIIEHGEEGCYIATAVYGDYDAPQVMVLRRYRDNTLAKSKAGRLFIKLYYRFSPPLAKRLKNTRRLNKAVRSLLDKFAAQLSEKE